MEPFWGNRRYCPLSCNCYWKKEKQRTTEICRWRRISVCKYSITPTYSSSVCVAFLLRNIPYIGISFLYIRDFVLEKFSRKERGSLHYKTNSNTLQLKSCGCWRIRRSFCWWPYFFTILHSTSINSNSICAYLINFRNGFP
jgi:hypothetical protein